MSVQKGTGFCGRKILHNSSSKMQVLWLASPGVDRTLGGVKCSLI